jgi:hypothetical protein
MAALCVTYNIKTAGKDGKENYEHYCSPAKQGAFQASLPRVMPEKCISAHLPAEPTTKCK